jgi:hypothetical protein
LLLLIKLNKEFSIEKRIEVESYNTRDIKYNSAEVESLYTVYKIGDGL